MKFYIKYIISYLTAENNGDTKSNKNSTGNTVILTGAGL